MNEIREFIKLLVETMSAKNIKSGDVITLDRDLTVKIDEYEPGKVYLHDFSLVPIDNIEPLKGKIRDGKITLKAGDRIRVEIFAPHDDQLTFEWPVDHEQSVGFTTTPAALGIVTRKKESNLNVQPKTTHKKLNLINAAKLTGHNLFDGHKSGLVWLATSNDDVRVIKTNTFKMLNNESGDIDQLLIGTFSYVFFPSRPGQGIDASDELNLITDANKCVDVDGIIYVASNEYETQILVINPTVNVSNIEDAIEQLD